MKALDQKESCTIAQDLEGVRRQFELWRSGRKRGARIPAELWQAAVSLFPQCSVHQIASALRLGNEDVRCRVEHEKKEGASDFHFWDFRLSELQTNIPLCQDSCRVQGMAQGRFPPWEKLGRPRSSNYGRSFRQRS